MIRSDTMYTAAAEKVGGTPSAQAWFAGGERVGYDPKLVRSLRRRTRPSRSS